MNPREFCLETGYDKTVLLTYNFDALFFERVILRDLWAAGTTDIQVIADLGRVTEAMPRWIGQVRQLGQRYQLTCANLRGSFHPKMIVRSGPDGAAVWIGSGNITYGGWGSNLEVGSAWRVGPEAADEGSWLRDVLMQLGEWLPSNDEGTAYRRILNTPWLADATEAPTNPPVLLSKRMSPIGQQLLDRWQGRRFDRMTIVTGSTDEQGALLSWFQMHFEVSHATVLLDPTMATFDPEKIAGLSLKTRLVELKKPRRVHAKFYWFEGIDGPAAVMGSANCSTAAWLLAPENGGNIESVLVYDHPSKNDFDPILSHIAKETKKAKLTMSQKEDSDETTPLPAYSLAEIAWEKAKSEIRVVFTKPLPAGTEVSLRICDERAVCQPDKDAMIWFAEMPMSAASMHGTLFGEVSITFAGGHARSSQQFWINDIDELRSSAAGREFGKPIRSLSRPSTPSEQQKIVAELQKIGNALLHDPSSFPDPLPTSRKASERRGAEEKEIDPQAVDPDQLIRSLDELAKHADRIPGAFNLHGVTLMGVIRVLFESDDEELERGAIDNPEEEDDEEPPGKKKPKEKAPTISKSAKERLHGQMNDFLNKLGEAEFAENCTVTQMVQATAYPLAIIGRGTSGHWVDVDVGREWTNRVFDILFREHYSNGSIGLLECIRRRCEANGQSAAFRQMAGDGTLWAALLDGVWRTAWAGVNGGLKKAFAMRAVLQSRHLLASTETGRMAALVNILEHRYALPTLLSSALRAKQILDELEKSLYTRWGQLTQQQLANSQHHDQQDTLYHPSGGWAYVLEQSEAMDEAKLLVYRQNRAGEITVKSNFYLNVTKAALKDSALSSWLQELASLTR